MSIVSATPRTRHQQAQLKAKLTREASKATKADPVNRVFGEGVFTTAKPAKPVRLYDGYGNPLKIDPVTAEDRKAWAELSAQLEADREFATRMQELDQDEAEWESYLQDVEATEAQLAHNRAYNWTGNLEW